MPRLPLAVDRSIALFPGVAVFFVASGFLISGSVLHSRPGLATYFRNRALRIYPALWINVALLLVMMASGGSLRFGFFDPMLWKWTGVTMVSTADYIANRLVFPNIGYPGGLYPNSFISGVLWTLPIEMSFYVLLPLILYPARKTIPLVLWTLASVAFFVIVPKTTLLLFIGHYLWIFMIGVVLQVYWHHVRRFFDGKALFWLAAYFVLGAIFFASGQPKYSYDLDSIWPLITVPVMGCAVISLAFTRPQTAKQTLNGNDISYGMYLWHMPIIYTAIGFGFSGWTVAILCWAVTAGVATISWQMIEKPALSLKKWRTAPVPSRATS